MFKKTVYLVICLTAVIALFSEPVNATKARDMGLGLYEYPWMIEGLQSYIYQNPAYLSKFSNQIFYVNSQTGEDAFSIYYGNSGGLIYSPMAGLNIGVFSGVALDDNVWNSNSAESFFHVGDYVLFPSASGYRPVVNLNGATISLIDPTGSYDSSNSYRKNLSQQDVSLMASYVWNKMAFGLNIGYGAAWSNDSFEQPDINVTDQKDKESYKFMSQQVDAILSWLFTFNDKMAVDADVHFIQYVLANKYDASTPGITTNLAYDSDGAMDIIAGAGFNWEYASMHKLHAKVGYAMLNHSTKGTEKYTDDTLPNNDFDVSEKFSRKGTEIKAGLSDEMRLSKNTTAFAGFCAKLNLFKYKYSGLDFKYPFFIEEYSNSVSSTVLPIILGIESKLSENWTGRFSVSHNLCDLSNSTSDNTVKILPGSQKIKLSSKKSNYNNNADSQINVGLSYQLGNFRFDWFGNIDLFTEGPYIISGKSTSAPGKASTPISMAFAATYLFGGPDSNNGKGILQGE